MSEPNLPRKRLSSAERARAEASLHEAFVDGQLTVTEFDERTASLYGATFVDELPALIDDLSPVTTQHNQPTRQDGTMARYATGESGGSRLASPSWAEANAAVIGSSLRITRPSRSWAATLSTCAKRG